MKPRGATELERMRLAGKRPAGFIVVTECPDIARNARQRDFCALVFDSEKRHDWRAIKSLDVRLATKLDRAAVAATCMAIVEAGPGSFGVTYFGKYEIEHDRVIHAAPR